MKHVQCQLPTGARFPTEPQIEPFSFGESRVVSDEDGALLETVPGMLVTDVAPDADNTAPAPEPAPEPPPADSVETVPVEVVPEPTVPEPAPAEDVAPAPAPEPAPAETPTDPTAPVAV